MAYTKTQFVSSNIWNAIGSACRSTKGRCYAAVPFVSTGAQKLLPLRKGDILVTRCDDTAARSGVTDPSEIQRYLERGVRVFHDGTLHAKVYTLGSVVFVGSANASNQSANVLTEAVVQSADTTLMKAARSFVQSLCREELSPEYVKKLKAIYRPPNINHKRGRTKRRAETSGMSRLWIARMYWRDFDEKAEAAAGRGKKRLQNALQDKSRYEFDEWEWPTLSEWVREIRPGDLMLNFVSDGKRSFVEPPLRFLGKELFREKGKIRVILLFERRKYRRFMPVGKFFQKLGSLGKQLRKLRRTHVISSRELLDAIWKVYKPTL